MSHLATQKCIAEERLFFEVPWYISITEEYIDIKLAPKPLRSPICSLHCGSGHDSPAEKASDLIALAQGFSSVELVLYVYFPHSRAYESLVRIH